MGTVEVCQAESRRKWELFRSYGVMVWAKAMKQQHQQQQSESNVVELGAGVAGVGQDQEQQQQQETEASRETPRTPPSHAS